MERPLIEIHPLESGQPAQPELPIASRHAAPIDVYPSPTARHLRLGLSFALVAVISALVGAIWLARHLPFVPSVEATAMTEKLLQQNSLLGDIETHLQQQSDVLVGLQQQATDAAEETPTPEQIEQQFASFQQQVQDELHAMQQEWDSLGAQLEADLESREHELAWVHYQLGISYLDQKRTREAIAEIEKALQRAPENALMWNQLGYCYLETKEHARAIQAFQRYVALSPQDPNAHDSLADGYMRTGNLSRAEKEYLMALRLAPSLGSAHYGLGQVYERMNRPRLAARQYERYLQISQGNTNEWVIRAKERLAALSRY